MILGKAAKLLAVGSLGTALSLAAASAAGALLYGFQPRDPATLAGAALILAVVTIVASLLPSMRAAKVNPIDSLRAGMRQDSAMKRTSAIHRNLVPMEGFASTV